MKVTNEVRLRYMGVIARAWMGHAGDEDVRSQAASGGVVSALLLHLLERGDIDAALVTKIDCSDGNIGCKVFLARSREEILEARTSKYVDVPVFREGVKLLEEFEGKVAVVALPCHTTLFRRLAERRPDLGRKIKYIVALLCGHSCRQYLLEKALEKQGVTPSEVTDFAFRRGHWRGQMMGTCSDGSEFAFPFNRFSVYHNLNFFCLPRCLKCHDHTGYGSDFSVGDAWLREMKTEPVKHSLLLTRNDAATAVVEQMIADGDLIARPTDAATVFRAQKRALIYHYNVSARARAGKWHGVRIKDTVHARVRWNDLLAAHLILINHRLSQNPRTRDWIFRVPRAIVYAYFLFLKFLQNF